MGGRGEDVTDVKLDGRDYLGLRSSRYEERDGQEVNRMGRTRVSVEWIVEPVMYREKRQVIVDERASRQVADECPLERAPEGQIQVEEVVDLQELQVIFSLTSNPACERKLTYPDESQGD